MYPRIFTPPENQSYFLLGPRGVGKSVFIKSRYPSAIYLDLLQDELYNTLLSSPERLSNLIPQDYRDIVVIDEIQRIPSLLNEVHRLIENRKLRFVLTGSSARKLKTHQSNLLGGRAAYCRMHQLCAEELGSSFDWKKSLVNGNLPQAIKLTDAKQFLSGYIRLYLQEEIQAEALTRNLPNFARFLQAASFSQGAPLVVSNVASDCHVSRKVVENYFAILRDTLLSHEIPIFTRRAKRKLLNKIKFYFFDVGVFRQIRPTGVIDSPTEIDGISLESLVLQEMLATINGHNWGYEIFYWRTQRHLEVDFILYGTRGFKAIEVKCAESVKERDFKGLLEFKKDYPECDPIMLYVGDREYSWKGTSVTNVENFLKNLSHFI